MKVEGLVHVRRREKRNRKILEINIGLSLCLVTKYKSFGGKRGTKKDVDSGLQTT